MEGNLLYLKSADLKNIPHSKKEKEKRNMPALTTLTV
jgi:hypothetical protein